jgi:basic membrane lipoprotein Med (substrate-binding protein (PBP1-ABC) superfamily)
MRITIEFKSYRPVKKVKSIYPDVKYYLIDRKTGKRIKTVWVEED